MAPSIVPESATSSSPADAREMRLEAIAEMLVYGATPQDVLARAQKHWGVSHRTAQEDLRTVRQRLAGDAAADDHLFSLRVSQLQRDKLVGLALRYMINPPEDLDPKLLQSLASLLTAVRGLLDSRDRTAAEIQQVVEERLHNGAKVVPVAEVPGPAAPGNGHAQPSLSCANGKGRKRRRQNGAAMTPAVGEPGVRALMSRMSARPPLPPHAPAVDGVSEAAAPKHRIDPEIRLESERAAAAAPVCAGCAGVCD
jgi:hypothetical protein